MNRFSSTTRIAIGLTCLLVSIFLAANFVGLLPDPRVGLMQRRTTLCEAVAIECSVLATDHDTRRIETVLGAIVQRNNDLRSAAYRGMDDRLIVDINGHESLWPRTKPSGALDGVSVGVFAGKEQRGNIEFVFDAIESGVLSKYSGGPSTRLILFVAAAAFVIYQWYLRMTMRRLDPSQAVPERVHGALNTLAEGLIVQDNSERIVLANEAFCKAVGRPARRLQGRGLSSLNWQFRGDVKEREFPWDIARKTGKPQLGIMLCLDVDDVGQRIFRTNSTPILSGDTTRGVLTSFDDVTALEHKKIELMEMLTMLKQSREEISSQNRELQLLATRDPLTGCLNRRAFFEHIDQTWAWIRKQNQPFCCVMMDIDHFKSINDNHGHQTGDVVLKAVARIISDRIRGDDLLCRYGGEEFCLIIPCVGLDIAAARAEAIREAIELEPIRGINVTASFGVAIVDDGIEDPQTLIEEADKCLYIAKRNGRNRVARSDYGTSELLETTSELSTAEDTNLKSDEVAIPFHAVTVLTSALSYRDADTAEHSRRVADLCVAAARGLMPVSEIYVLEVAALLHDIGKIGVPDTILLKPGPLTDEEWHVMDSHERIGTELISTTFNSPQLTEFVSTHHAWYGGHPRCPHLPTGEDICLGARLLGIADSYDAIVSDRVYRKGRTRDEAFAELRRCAPRQFDPELVERFIDTVLHRSQSADCHLSNVSTQTAISIGRQIESLARALDEQDLSGLAALAGRLKTTTTKLDVPEIAEMASEVVRLLNSDADLSVIIQVTDRLLHLCRSTQHAYVKSAVAPQPVVAPIPTVPIPGLVAQVAE